ncbi:Annexin D3 [Linum grandiflorum]
MATLAVPDVVPSPAQDSQNLMKACRGLGTDEKAIIRILGNRNSTQRREIRDTYQQLYKESLIDRLRSELSRDFGRAIIMWTYDPAERDAILANEALKGGKKLGVKQLQVIVEIACSISPHHLQSVKQAYSALFHCSLEEAIASVVSLPLRKVLVGLVRSYRYDKEVVDMNIAHSEASKLYEAIELKKLDEEDVLYILTTRNVYQLKATFDLYQDLSGNPIHQDLKGYGEGDLESLLGIATQCMVFPEKHFAEVIRKSIVGLGTDEDSLTRAIVGRAEVDLGKVRAEYSNMYGKKLEDDVIGDTSGDYKDTLLTLLGHAI